MGQYFMPILGNVYGLNCKVFDRSINGEYTLAKLLEHSWWQNPFVNSFSSFLHNNPGRVCWVGDYATEPDDFKLNVPVAITRPNYKKVWGKNVKLLSCAPSAFTLDGQFLDLDKYKANSVGSDGWIIHPLPLLTAIGNDRGGGDFHSGVGYKLIGSWAWQLIAFFNQPPKDFTKVDIRFIEER